MNSARGSVLPGVLSGALAALSLPPFHLWPLAFVALVPLTWALRSPDAGNRRPGVSGDPAAPAGLAFGAVFYGTLLHWVPFTAHGMTPAGALSGVLAIAILTGVAGMQAVALHRLLSRWGVSPVLALPLVWTGAEVALAHAGPLAFPWTPLGLALAASPGVAGIAEWVGPRGLTLWITAVNGGVLVALRARGIRALLPAAATAAVVAIPALWGVSRAGTLPLHALPPVLVAQLDIPRDTLLDPVARDRAAGAALERIGGAGEVDGADPGRPRLLILPEAPFASAWGEGTAERFRRLAASLALPVVAGTHQVGSDGERRNTVVLVDPAGRSALLHSKLRLVPGVERPGLAAGPPGAASEVGGIRLGLLICFEAAFDGAARRRRAEGAELLVNPSNDGWLRPAAMGPLPGAALAQHRAHLVLRAVETRAGAVRASLGGELLVVDPRGRAILSRSPGGEGVLPVRPLTSTETTLFVRFGEAGVLGLLLLLAGGAAIGARRRLAGTPSGEAPEPKT